MFGRVELIKKSWRIRAVPHVMMRLKRWFKQAPQGEGDSLLLHDNPSNAAELAWILERYPMQMSEDDRLLLVLRAEEQKDREVLIASVQSGKAAKAFPAFKLALPAREYQVEAAQLCYHSGSLLLADQMGVGKTCSAIELLSYEGCLPAIVVVPTHLPRQWENEIHRFAPNVTTHVLERSKPYPWPTKEPPQVVITNWFKIVGWAEHFVREGRYRTLVLDEAHELRHHDTERYRAVSSLRQSVDRALLTTGTPIFNYGGELWSVMNIAAPDALGSRQEFIREWCGGSDATDSRGNSKPRVTDPRALGIHLRTSGLMLRRTRSDVGRELPPLCTIVQTVEADNDALLEVEDQAEALAKVILSGGSSNFAKMKAGGELDNKIRQATGVAKAPHVAHFVRLMLEEGERVVLFAWHKNCYKIYKELLEKWKPLFYTGEETAAQKEEAKRRFIDKNHPEHSPILIMSLRAGVGLDGLQGHCNNVVFGELDWAPAIMEQCIARVYRDGQTQKVFVYYLLAETGCDPIMSDVLQIKSGQLEGIRDPDAAAIEKLQTDPAHIKKLAASYLAKKQSRERAA